jgi:hypothetical protein
MENMNDKWKKVALEAVPFLLLWAAFFMFGLWLRRQIPLDVPPGELHGLDYNGHGELFADHRLITFTRFRHPLFGWLMSPIPLFGARIANVSFIAYWGYLSFIFSGIVAASVWMVYRISAQMDGVGKVSAAVCAGLFACFGYVRYLAAGPESFSVSMLLALAVLWWGVRSPFVVGRQPLQGKGVYDKLVWFLLFVVATGITLTQGAKVVLAYLVSRRMTKRDWICLASGAAAAVLAAVGFYVVKLMLLGSGGRTVSSAFADLFSCIPHDLTIVQRLRMLEMFFFEPIVPHGVPYSVSEIVVAYSSWWQYALCAAIYLATAVGAYRMRSTLLVKMIVVMFCVDAVIHLVMFWGMSEAQIYCGHWFYVLPILIAGAWKKGVIKKPSDML